MWRQLGYQLFAVYSVLHLVHVVVNTGIAAVIAIAVSLLTTDPRATYLVARTWSRYNLLFTGVRVRVTGAEHIEAGHPYVAMANHQSLIDVWALIAYLPLQLAWVMKHEIRRIPLIGFSGLRQGHIYIDRGHGAKALESLRLAGEKIRGGVSVFIFPEGTRSPDGQLTEFKTGGFVLAQSAGVPILPITVNGGRRIFRKGSLRLRPGEMQIVVHPSIAVERGDDRAQRKQLMAATREAIGSALVV